jgi:hypothetical protein
MLHCYESCACKYQTRAEMSDIDKHFGLDYSKKYYIRQAYKWLVRQFLTLISIIVTKSDILQFY